MINVYVNASDVAKYTRHNKFASEEERRQCFWSSNKKLKDLYGVVVDEKPRTAIAGELCSLAKTDLVEIRNNLRLPDQSSIQDIANEIRRAVVAPCSNARTNEEMTSMLDQTVSQAFTSTREYEKLAAAVEQDARMERGSKQEDSSLTTCEAYLNEKITQRNERLYKKLIFGDGVINIYCIGKIDGFAQDTQRVVEVKERRKRLFNVVQCSC